MQKIHLEFENCYGIKKLAADFDFTMENTYVIYSPNGTMKTSFAKAMGDFAAGRESEDSIFTERVTKRQVQNEEGEDLLPDQVFVIEPYNESFTSNKISTLLVNKKLKDKYEIIHKKISEKKEHLIKELKPLCQLKKSVEEEISLAFTHSDKEFYNSLSEIKDEILDKDSPEFEDILYARIFSEKIIDFLDNSSFKASLTDYIKKYDELIDSSIYFRKGVFNHNNASVIAKNLKDNGFFKANHTVNLKSSSEKKEITTEKELENVINEEKESILSNPGLINAFEKIDSKLKANKELRDFRDYLIDNIKILPELSNLESFKKKLWVSYLKKCALTYESLVNEYNIGKERIEKIVEEAKREETNWREVIEIFNDRFDVPFELSIENQEDVILKNEGPNIKFAFKEADESKEINESALLKILSNGEKRALYILNIIFEVEARRKNNKETLFIIDDIADSFDYKNKYAIIEYLKDISLHDGFNQILLSHNFDFFRTVCSRLDMLRKQKLHTIKTKTDVRFVEEEYQNNPFKIWRDKLAKSNAMLIASIPLVRNIAEYSGDLKSYKKLTSLLHHKLDTNNFKVSHLERIHKSILKDQDKLNLKNGDKLVLDLIFEEADKIGLDDQENINLENKIVLSIAIRLKAEAYMKKKIDDNGFFKSISSNQTYTLIKKYSEMFSSNKKELEILNQVNLMTPENIHLNSFMYEPILDMSNHALVALYKKAKRLGNPPRK